jgi:uncharacterized protein YqeY
MSLYDTISKDITTAMKNKEASRLDALRFMKSLLLQNKTAAKPTDELQIIVAHAKKLKDSLEMFPKDSENYLKTVAELKVIEEYMPAPLSEAQVKDIIQKIITANPGINMGGVMKELTPQVKGRFDGKLANDLVKAALA